MSWEAIGAIGELVGAIAVIATIGYLAVQIRHSSKIASIQASQHLLEGSSAIRRRIAEDENLRRIYWEGCRSYESLEPQDRQIFYALVGDLLQRYEVQTQMHDAGMLNRDNFAAATRGITRLLRNPGVRTVCRIAIDDDVPSERFRKLIEAMLTEAPSDA